MDVKQLIAQLTLEEKAGLCSGKDFWRTKSVERLGIPSILVSDGPHGLRTQKENTDHLGLNDSVEAICFPSGATLASSWDKELLNAVGVALGEESQAEGVHVLLGPAVNIKRSPLCGRNFEYFSEDPFLSTILATSFINGVQSQGVGTSIKHFAANNQEYKRMSISSEVDERTFREIYLASFEGAVKNAQPWTVMCSYNQINGEFASQNSYLLTDILKKEWGHEGLVVSDWGAVYEREKGLAAGLELEMPTSHGYGDRKIVEAVKSGFISEAQLDAAVERILKVVFKAKSLEKPGATYDKDAHHAFARKVATESMVLLKNEEAILPLNKSGKYAVIGAFAETPRYQGGGSSHINVTKTESALDGLKNLIGIDVSYAKGFEITTDDVNEALFEEAKATAAAAEVAILFLGLPDRYESEGYDRSHMSIPVNQIALLQAVYQVQKNIVVVLCNGSPIEMPWLGQAKAVLDGYLGGQAVGGAVAQVLFGEVNPSGKLAETFPVKLSHNPSYLNFPGEEEKVEYKEGIFVGYRYYQRKGIAPLFPFGYGLSYTTFEYSDLTLSDSEISDADTVTVTFKVKNTGKVFGKEVVQLYVKDVLSTMIRPDYELKEFAKISLEAGEEKEVTFELSKRAFAYYNVSMKDWHVESGDFVIAVGGSSESLPLQATLKVNSTQTIKKVFSKNSTIGEIWHHPAAKPLIDGLMAQFQGADTDALGMDFAEMVKGSVLRLLSMMGMMSDEQLDGLVEQLNS